MKLIRTKRMLQDINKNVAKFKKEKPFRMCASIVRSKIKVHKNNQKFDTKCLYNYWFREIYKDPTNFNLIFKDFCHIKGTNIFLYWTVQNNENKLYEFTLLDYPVKEYYTVQVYNKFSDIFENKR